jgi:uncharacterized protein YjbI with pentapeptide repeats
MNDLKKYSRLENIEINPRNVKIDFDEFPSIKIIGKEIYNCEISGTFRKTSERFRGNVVMSSVINFTTDNADLNNVDWKDSNFRNCRFEKTSLDLSAIINCHFAKCKLIECHFDDMAITGSEFYDVEFYNCNLSNIVIESCRFFNCQFHRCKSSNKIFEHCLLFDCSFNNTDIQLQTIIENFGLEKKQTIHCNIRSASCDEEFTFLSESDLQKLYSVEENSILDFYKFKIEYFLNPEITIEGSDSLDNVFNIEEWLPLCKARTTFINMFKSFHDFILILFEQNKTLLLCIYKLKYLTKRISDQDAIKSNFELYPVIMGYDIALARILSQANLILQDTNERVNKSITLLVEGPLDKDFYYNSLRSCIKGNFNIKYIKKQNSPNIMEIAAISSVIVQIIGLFVVTRVKLEFANRKVKKNTKHHIKKIQQKKEIALNLYELSRHSEEWDNNDLLQQYFSNSLTFNIEFQKFKTSEAGKVRKIIIDIYD